MYESNLTLEELAELSDKNDIAAAQDSFKAQLHHWKDGSLINCKTWIEQILVEVSPLAKEMNLLGTLAPLYASMTNGNQAMQWINDCSSGKTLQEVIQDGIETMKSQETPQTQIEARFA